MDGYTKDSKKKDTSISKEKFKTDPAKQDGKTRNFIEKSVEEIYPTLIFGIMYRNNK